MATIRQPRYFMALPPKDAGVLDDVKNVGRYMWHGGAHHVGFDVHDAVASPEVIASDEEKDYASVLAHAPRHTFGQGECIGCKGCESRCPFGVRIAERMVKTAQLFQT